MSIINFININTLSDDFTLMSTSLFATLFCRYGTVRAKNVSEH